jgi:S1-C subfamily serine protease
MRLRTAAAITLLSGFTGALMGVGAVQVLDGGGEPAAVSAPAPTSSASDREVSQPQSAARINDCLSAAEIYENVRPAVVQITASAGRAGGTGAGVVVDEEGHILTNNHVVSGSSTIEVRFADGSTSSATVIGSDPANDLALLRLSDPDSALAFAPLGDSDSLRPGDSVLAIGNPFNLEGTLTQGIVSALDRTYSAGASTRPIRGMIQTDAAINPGNSGGPLLNCAGEVVGINTLLKNPTGENVNVGVAFAVAINTAKRSLDDMLTGQTVSHPWLGIAGVDVTPGLAQELGLDAESGVYVTLVSARSPAAASGLEGAFSSENQAAGSEGVPPGGDVIVAVDGEPVSGIEELAGHLDQEKRPGDQVELSVVRSGEEITLTALLSEWPVAA